MNLVSTIFFDVPRVRMCLLDCDIQRVVRRRPLAHHDAGDLRLGDDTAHARQQAIEAGSYEARLKRGVLARPSLGRCA